MALPSRPTIEYRWVVRICRRMRLSPARRRHEGQESARVRSEFDTRGSNQTDCRRSLGPAHSL